MWGWFFLFSPYQFRQLQEIAAGAVKKLELLSVTCAMHLISVQVLPFFDLGRKGKFLPGLNLGHLPALWIEPEGMME